MRYNAPGTQRVSDSNARANMKLHPYAVVILGGMALLATTSPGGPPRLPLADETPDAADGPSLVGVIFARQEVNLSAEIEGRIEAVHADLGDQVRRGAVLVVLDAWSIQRDLEKAQAELQSAQAEERKAGLEYELAREKRDRRDTYPDSWSAEEIAESHLQEELAAANSSVAQARVARARAAVEQLAEMLAAREIRAPFDGTVAGRYLDVGAMVASGQPLIRLISEQELWVRFAAPESLAGALAIGLPVTVTIPATGNRIRGGIAHISPEIDPASQLLTVEAPLAVPDSLSSQVRSGMAARVTLALPGDF
jgi:RND family efflux transporter MFP subunit